jgi:hypothetical protein|tara:strand:- start:106 stop:432 length:327 start_codon:yes stop_codon:yes gene_type:complete
MNSIEEITQKEKKISYVQRDKELFSFYTLTLITQEQASRKIKIKLWSSLFLLTVFISLFLSPINQIISYVIVQLNNISIVDILIMALISYGVTGLCIILLKNRTNLFK